VRREDPDVRHVSVVGDVYTVLLGGKEKPSRPSA
jgi:hypothetical protein